MLRGCCGCGCAGGVPHTLLVVRLLVEAEKRGRPCAETVGLLEHSQRELLQTTSTNVLHGFLWLIIHIFLPRLVSYPTVTCQLSSARESGSHFIFVLFFFHFFFHFVSNRSWKWSISKDRHCSEKFRKVMKCTRTRTHTLWELITIQSPPNDVQYFYQLFLFLEQRPQCRIQTIYFSLAAR